MGVPLDEAEFGRLLGSFEQAAFRLEQQPSYAEDLDQTWLARWLAGDRTPPTEGPEFVAWFDMIRAHTAAGRLVQRVRIQEVPPTEYQQWEAWIGRWNAAAGEQLRYLERPRAVEAGLLPAAGPDDWWLLDDRQLIVMTFDTDGRRILTTLVEECAAVEQAQAWRDLAIHHSAPAHPGA